VEDGAGKDTTRAPGIDDKKSVATDATPKRRKRVLASYDDMKHVVEKLDTSRTGQITSRDLNNALGRLGIKMKRSDFRRLAGEVDPPACRTHLPTLGKVPEEPTRQRNENGKSSVRQSDLVMQAATAGAWRQRLESQVSRVWKQLQRDFKRLDPNRTSLIDMHILIPALSHYGINLQTLDADALYLQMGVGRSGKINYGEFLKCFVGGGLARQGAISAPPNLVTGSNSNKINKHKGSSFHKRTDMGVPSDIEGYLRSATIHWRAIRQSCQVRARVQVCVSVYCRGVQWRRACAQRRQTPFVYRHVFPDFSPPTVFTFFLFTRNGRRHTRTHALTHTHTHTHTHNPPRATRSALPFHRHFFVGCILHDAFVSQDMMHLYFLEGLRGGHDAFVFFGGFAWSSNFD